MAGFEVIIYGRFWVITEVGRSQTWSKLPCARSVTRRPQRSIRFQRASASERAFFSCWTRKEAYVKAIGVGISRPLNTFRVTVKPDAPANLLFLDDATNASNLWTLQDLQLEPDYAGAVAYSDQQRPLSIFSTIDSEQFLNIP
jgi:phosphopantetheinyl transferase